MLYVSNRPLFPRNFPTVEIGQSTASEPVRRKLICNTEWIAGEFVGVHGPVNRDEPETKQGIGYGRIGGQIANLHDKNCVSFVGK
jgi:hypothetical protein